MSAFEVEAARSLASGYKNNNSSGVANTKMLASMLSEFQRKRAPVASSDSKSNSNNNRNNGFTRSKVLAMHGESLLPILKSGLANIKEDEGNDDARRVWAGMGGVLVTFLSPEEVVGELATTPGSLSVEDSDAVIDTSLAILSVAISFCPAFYNQELNQILIKVGIVSLEAAKWHNRQGLDEGKVEGELRIVRAVLVNLGLREEVRDLGNFVDFLLGCLCERVEEIMVLTERILESSARGGGGGGGRTSVPTPAGTNASLDRRASIERLARSSSSGGR